MRWMILHTGCKRINARLSYIERTAHMGNQIDSISVLVFIVTIAQNAAGELVPDIIHN